MIHRRARFSKTVSVVFAAILLAPVGCSVDNALTPAKRTWYEQALGAQARTSGVFAYYEGAQAAITYAQSGADVCGPKSLEEIVDPVLAELHQLEGNAVDAGFESEVTKAVSQVANALEAFRARLAEYSTEASNVPKLPLPENCMHAGQVLDFRSEVEGLYMNLLKVALP